MSKICSSCGAENKDEAKFCKNCGQRLMKEESEQFEIVDRTIEHSNPGIDMSTKEEYSSIGGWLILVGIGVVVSPFRLLIELFNIYLPIFKDGTWEALTTYGSEAYNEAFSYLLIGEIVFNFLLMLASMYLIYLFFAKKYLFPKLYIWIILISLVMIPLDSFFVSSIFPDIKMFDSDTAKDFARTLFFGLIWIPYMLISKRVKGTFVN